MSDDADHRIRAFKARVIALAREYDYDKSFIAAVEAMPLDEPAPVPLRDDEIVPMPPVFVGTDAERLAAAQSGLDAVWARFVAHPRENYDAIGAWLRAITEFLIATKAVPDKAWRHRVTFYISRVGS